MCSKINAPGTPLSILDWLTWFSLGSDDRVEEHRMMLKNLGVVVNNYVNAGVKALRLGSVDTRSMGAGQSLSLAADSLAGRPLGSCAR